MENRKDREQPSIEILRDLYTVQGKSNRQIASILGISKTSVGYWIQKFGIEVGDAGHASGRPVSSSIPTADELRDMYVTREMPQTEIAGRFGVSQQTLTNWLKRYGIEARGCQEARRRYYARAVPGLDVETLRELFANQHLSMREIADRYKCGETAVRHNLIRLGLYTDAKEEARREKKAAPRPYQRVTTPAYEEMYQMYVVSRMSQMEIAKRFNVSQATIGQRLTELGIERKEPVMMARGYRLVVVPKHPRANKNGYITEHRQVAEKAIGRYVGDDEVIHHIDMRKINNGVENLAVLPSESVHQLVHRYYQRGFAYLSGLGGIRPEAIDFGVPVFWGGAWVTSLDIIGDRKPFPRPEVKVTASEPTAAEGTIN